MRHLRQVTVTFLKSRKSSALEQRAGRTRRIQSWGGKTLFWLFSYWIEEFVNITEIWGWRGFCWGSLRNQVRSFILVTLAALNTPPHQWSTFIPHLLPSQTGAFSKRGLVLMRFWIPIARLHFLAKYRICAVLCATPPRLGVARGQEEKNGLYLSSLWLWIRIINPPHEPFQSSLLHTHTLKMEGAHS